MAQRSGQQLTLRKEGIVPIAWCSYFDTIVSALSTALNVYDFDKVLDRLANFMKISLVESNVRPYLGRADRQNNPIERLPEG